MRQCRGTFERSPSPSRSEMQRFEPIAVGIDDIGCEIVRAIVRADAWLAVVPPACGKGCGVKPRDALAIGRGEADMQSRLRIFGDGRFGDGDPKAHRLLAVAERVLDTPYKLPLICCQDSTNRRDSDSKRFAPSRAGLDRVMSKPLSASVWETLSPQRRRGVVLLLAQLARRRIQSPSSVEETVDHGRESRAAAGRLHAREDYATASRAPGDHLHSPVDASAG